MLLSIILFTAAFLGLCYAEKLKDISKYLHFKLFPLTLNIVEDPNAPPTFHILPELVSGMLAGVITCAAFYPLECIEARLQVKGGSADGKAKQGYFSDDNERPQLTFIQHSCNSSTNACPRRGYLFLQRTFTCD